MPLRVSSGIAVSVGHLQIEQDLSDGHSAHFFGGPAKFLAQDKTSLCQGSLYQFFQSVARRTDPADAVNPIQKKTCHSSRQLPNLIDIKWRFDQRLLNHQSGRKTFV